QFGRAADPAVVQLVVRRLYGGDDGLGNDGRRLRQYRRSPPRPVRDAAVCRLSYGRLLLALAQFRPLDPRTAAHFLGQLVQKRRERKIPLAGIRREYAYP